MSTAQLKASLMLWTARERYRKTRHDFWQRRVDRARKLGTHPRAAIIKRRDHWSVLLDQARAEVVRRREQLGKTGPASGIDASNNNGHVDFAKVHAAGYRFVFLKASEGTGFTDPFFAASVTAAKAAGLKVGAYHFLNTSSAAAQAKRFCALVRAAGLSKGDLLPVVDAEKAGTGPSLVREFVDAVHQELGVKPLIYTFPAYADWPSTYGCKLWIAHPGARKPTIPSPWKTYAAWQKSFTGRVPGVNGDCDTNTTHDLAELTW